MDYGVSNVHVRHTLFTKGACLAYGSGIENLFLREDDTAFNTVWLTNFRNKPKNFQHLPLKTDKNLPGADIHVRIFGQELKIPRKVFVTITTGVIWLPGRCPYICHATI